MTNKNNADSEDHGAIHAERMAKDERYAGRHWDDIEPDAQTAWERDNEGKPGWHTIRESVRSTWERINKS